MSCGGCEPRNVRDRVAGDAMNAVGGCDVVAGVRYALAASVDDGRRALVTDQAAVTAALTAEVTCRNLTSRISRRRLRMDRRWLQAGADRTVRVAALPCGRVTVGTRWRHARDDCASWTVTGACGRACGTRESPERRERRTASAAPAGGDTPTHALSSFVDGRGSRLEVEDVTPGQCSRPVPALTCVASNGWVRSSGRSPRTPAPTGGYR